MRVELRGITKRFPGVIANEDVSLVFEPGEVHALLGENGAGKSTLMNVLFGLYEAEEGEVLVDGEPVHFKGPTDAIAAGIGMVHQHFKLVPVFTVAENVMLGHESTKGFGVLDHKAADAKVEELSARYGLAVDPDALIEDLPVGIQQRVEIIKALTRDARCLILDEPTAVLTPNEIDELLEIVRQLRADGRAIVFITHKLREVLAVADRISVLRRGRMVGSADPKTTTPAELANMMVGRDVKLAVDKESAAGGEVVLEIDDLTVLDDRDRPVVDGVDLDVRAGEIVALAGVDGNGQTELVHAITGLRRPTAGTVTLSGRDVTGAKPHELFDMGLAYVPEDRQRHGLIGSFSLADNLVLNRWNSKPYAKGIVRNWGAVVDHASGLIDDFDIRTSGPGATVDTLSGGNQQKVIIARELSREGPLVILSQPTRGLDVGSIQYIHGRAVARRDAGSGVLLVSSELDEVLALADRVAVMYRGRIVGVLEGERLTRENVGLLMAGQPIEDASTEAVS
ncbi:MAG TPA: ABC transporter ATP-binding protein [Acidimicrobiales bacterium]|nr:ABC transporter ATP-binding protein [Acidimicrobiales bacterium]